MQNWNAQRYQQLLDAAIDYIYSVLIREDETVAVGHSPGCVKVTGYTPAEYQQDPQLWYTIIHPDDRQQVLEQLYRLRGGEVVPPLEHRIIHKNGTSRWIKNIVVPVYDEQHHLLGYDGLVVDITARKQAELQAIRTERLAALGQLAATLAHEINNPLQAIQANLDLMLDFPVDNREKQALLARIRQEIERLQHISQRVLSYARPQPITRQTVPVKEIIKQVLTLAGRQLEHNAVHVSTEFRPVLPVLAAPTQLLQVFLNMTINAIEAKASRLHITVAPDNDCATISFANNGPPIPVENLPYLFEPFYTTKTNGSGLGLWVSHMLVQQHNGTLSVENMADDQGVVFTIRLPATK